MVEKKKNNLKFALQIALLLISVITGLFLHSKTGAFNFGAIVALLAIAIYFLRTDLHLFGPALFSLLAFITGFLPIASLGLIYIIPLAVYSVIIWLIPALSSRVRWFYWGKADQFTWLAGLGVVIISSLSLYLWTVIFKPNLNDLIAVIPRNLGFGALIFVGVGFAVINSMVEESIYRGVIWEALGRLFRRVWVVNLVQAAIFGAAHFRGFPRGAVGISLAFVYGLLLGEVRRRTKGLLAPFIVHFFADMTIFILLIWIARKL
jgi:uncharacterized protein